MFRKLLAAAIALLVSTLFHFGAIGLFTVLTNEILHTDTAYSAVATVLPSGVFMTAMPLALAASRSTLSTPTPARAITFSLVAAAMSAASGTSLRASAWMVVTNWEPMRPIPIRAMRSNRGLVISKGSP